MRIKLNTNALINRVQPLGTAKDMIAEWYNVTGESYKKKFITALENKDAVKVMQAVSESTHPHNYSMSEIMGACALYLGKELEDRVEQLDYFDVSSVLSYLFFKEMYLENDDTVFPIIQGHLDSIYGAYIDKLILTKDFIELCENRYNMKVDEVISKYFHNTSTFNEIIKEK